MYLCIDYFLKQQILRERLVIIVLFSHQSVSQGDSIIKLLTDETWTKLLWKSGILMRNHI